MMDETFQVLRQQEPALALIIRNQKTLAQFDDHEQLVTSLPLSQEDLTVIISQISNHGLEQAERNTDTDYQLHLKQLMESWLEYSAALIHDE